jgi:peptidoglycan-associated lipoprotein
MKLRTSRLRFELHLARRLALIAAFAALVTVPALSACGGPEYPSCDTDDDCHAGEFCVNNMCQQCRTDDDCGAGNRCAAGACEAVPGYCTSDSDCGAGQQCQNNLCVTAAQTAAPPPPAAGPCQLTAAYFGFDSSTLDPSARDQLARNAECIKSRGIASVHLTGLCDPRGTEEYNLALGDRRASSARDYLQSLGVQAQITHSSMGEELAVGTDEASWSRDRRVDFSER